MAGCLVQPGTAEPDLYSQVTPVQRVVYDRSLRGQILGVVYNDTTGAPLPNVLVVLDAPGRTLLEATTDAYGRYHFDGLPAGSYAVFAFVRGTASRTLTLDGVRPGVARFALDPDLVRVCFFHLQDPGKSILSPSEAEAHLLGIPNTVYR